MKDYLPLRLHRLPSVFLGALGILALFWFTGSLGAESDADARLPLAVLGDSDSHSYGDTIWFPLDSDLRGGAYRASTLQWTEVVERLRGNEIDLGDWGIWGQREIVGKVSRLVGLGSPRQRKQDYEYNFAVTGSNCDDLYSAKVSQTAEFLRVAAESPDSWHSGVVQIRIGINDLGTREFLDRVAQRGLDDEVVERVDRCLAEIAASTQAIRTAHPSIAIVVVGILNNSDWPPYFDLWQTAAAQANINQMLDRFDSGLRALANSDSRTAFFDDRAWFLGLWGGRDTAGRPKYRPYAVNHDVAVSNTQGDESRHAIIEDGHGGTLHNAIWVRDFLIFLNREFDTGLTPLSVAEIVALAGGVPDIE